ncbi:MAG: hypothetical protein HDP34_04825 [Clostridia bacterium]|nr:hypothetical protein [Clostridia bacterium]
MGRFKFAIRNLVGAAGVFASAFYIAESGIYTMIIIGGTAFIAGIFSFGIHDEESGKRYGPYMLLYGAILVLAGVLCLSFNKSFWILKYVGAVAVALTGYFQWIKLGKIFSPKKLLRKIETLAIFVFPIIIMAGVILSVFTQKLLLGKTLIIIGAVIWTIHNLYALILMDSDGNPDLSRFSPDAREAAHNFDRNKILDEDDVMNIVHLIAKRFERKRDSLPNSAAVTFYVFEEVNGSHISYKICGTLHDTLIMPNDKKIELEVALQRKVQQMQQGIIKMTQRELSKYNLPYSSYNIEVEIGNFE